MARNIQPGTEPTARPSEQTQPRREQLLVDLALQGGGSHGAFTWGVLDRLLEEEWLTIEAISGTSAGAMNAALLASGFASGGAQGAREALTTFWKSVSDAARYSPFQRSPLDVLLGRWSLDHSPMFLAMDMMARVLSPYDLNPRGNNPLADILADQIDFDAVAKGSIKLFITATNVHTGRGRVFRHSELTVDVLLASACLPSMFQAIEIDGEKYWDGGYSGNPSLVPLMRECKSNDTLLVQINPIARNDSPRSAADILSRLNEISFNAVLLKELRAMALFKKLDHIENSEAARLANMRIHRISSLAMNDLGYSSKLNAEWAFLTMLRDEGRKAAALFMTAHADDLGHRETTLTLDDLLDDI